jgi:hypothetical protein
MEATDLIGLGDHPALEFVNTTATPVGLELVGNGQKYVDWLERVELIGGPDMTAIHETFTPAEFNAAADARQLREWLRAGHRRLGRHTAGHPAHGCRRTP